MLVRWKRRTWAHGSPEVLGNESKFPRRSEDLMEQRKCIDMPVRWSCLLAWASDNIYVSIIYIIYIIILYYIYIWNKIPPWDTGWAVFSQWWTGVDHQSREVDKTFVQGWSGQLWQFFLAPNKILIMKLLIKYDSNISGGRRVRRTRKEHYQFLFIWTLREWLMLSEMHNTMKWRYSPWPQPISLRRTHGLSVSVFSVCACPKTQNKANLILLW